MNALVKKPKRLPMVLVLASLLLKRLLISTAGRFGRRVKEKGRALDSYLHCRFIRELLWIKKFSFFVSTGSISNFQDNVKIQILKDLDFLIDLI
jgi:hypothetical protein